MYSLGCVLYEMLAGQPPFVGPTAAAIIARQMLDDVPSITVVRGTVPDEVEDAVMRALDKQPADRYGSALEFAEALEHSIETRGRSLGPTDRRSRPRRRATTGERKAARRRGRVLLAAGVAVALVGSALSAWRVVSGRAAAAMSWML